MEESEELSEPSSNAKFAGYFYLNSGAHSGTRCGYVPHFDTTEMRVHVEKDGHF